MNYIICKIVSLICVFFGMSIPVAWGWIAYPWLRPIVKPIYKPNRHSLVHLKTLIKIMCEVNSWLGPGNNPLTEAFKKDYGSKLIICKLNNILARRFMRQKVMKGYGHCADCQRIK